MNATSVLAVLGLAFGVMGTAIASVVGFLSQRALRRQEEHFTLRQESEEFITDKLDHLYLPVAMHLAATKLLFDRYFEGSTTDEEKLAIEHEMRPHNTEVRQRLMEHSKYLEPDAPEDMTIGLLSHLVQWDTELKYEYHIYDGPVFAGISQFGFRRFPEEADQYFMGKMRELRMRQHVRSATYAESIEAPAEAP